MAREYFQCFHSYLGKIKKLSDQEVGRLFRALLEYSANGTAPELTGRESIAFDFIADDIDNAKEAYEILCQQNAKNRNNDRQRPTTTVNDRARPSTTVDDRQRPTTTGDEIDKDKDNIKESKEILSNESTKKAAKASFTPPTVEEVASYCRERKNGINAQAFCDYYARQGWKLSNGIAVKDWKACVRTWENRDKERGRNHGSENYAQKTIRMEELDNYIGG